MNLNMHITSQSFVFRAIDALSGIVMYIHQVHQIQPV